MLIFAEWKLLNASEFMKTCMLLFSCLCLLYKRINPIFVMCTHTQPHTHKYSRSFWGWTLTVFPFLCAVCGRMPVVGGFYASSLVWTPTQGGPAGWCRATPGCHMLPLQRGHTHHALLRGVWGSSCPRTVHVGTHAVQGLHGWCVGYWVDGRSGCLAKDTNQTSRYGHSH